MRLPKPGCAFLIFDVLVIFVATVALAQLIDPTTTNSVARYSVVSLGLLVAGSLVYWALKAIPPDADITLPMPRAEGVSLPHPEERPSTPEPPPLHPPSA